MMIDPDTSILHITKEELTMKSRILVAFGIALLLVLAASAAMAETGACPLHPNAEVVLVPTTEYACVDSGKHCAYSWNEMFCAECGNYLGEDKVHITVSDSESHSFDSKAVCAQCGFNMSLNRQRSQIDGIAINDMQMMAKAIGRSAIGGTLEVLGDSVNVRAEYNAASKVLTAAYYGDVLKIQNYALDYDGNVWYSVRVKDVTGWINANLVKVTPNPNPVVYMYETEQTPAEIGAAAIGGTLEVLDMNVNVRTDHNATSKVIASVPAGARIAILDYAEDDDGNVWYGVRVNRKNGWISANLVRVSPNPNPVTDKNTVTVKAEGNVRAGAGTSYDVVGYAHVNNVFQVLNTVTVADGGVWYMIQFGDTTAWISAAICR